MSTNVEYHCIRCGIELDPEEYSDPRDADLCGYCFAAKLNELGALDCHHHHYLQAAIEIYRDHAQSEGKRDAVDAYERILRQLHSIRW